MEQILIPVANPETIENLVNLALVIKDAKQKNGMIALNVINDNNSSENKELQGKRNLEKAAMIAAAADVPVTMVSRYDLNIASGIIHTIKEYEATDVVIGLHRKANIVDSFFGNLAESLLKGTHREVMIAKFLMPVNTLRRIIIAVPPKAEFETGFSKWVEHFCRMGSVFRLPCALLCQRTYTDASATTGEEEIQRYPDRIFSARRVGRPSAADRTGELRSFIRCHLCPSGFYLV